MKEGYVTFDCVLSKEIVEIMNPELTYPKWIKEEIKRKYGKSHAIYLDVWMPYQPSLWELMPKRKWRN